MKLMGDSKKEIVKGKPFEVYSKIIYPVAQISIQKDYNGDIIAAEILPIALIVEEDNERYIVPIIDELENIKDYI